MLRKKIFFLSIISSCITYINTTQHSRNPSLEMQTILDHDKPSKLEPVLLEKDPFTRATLREIILKTHESKQLPSNTNDVFEKLLEYNFNFIQLRTTLDSKIDKLLKNEPSKEKTKEILLTAFQIACNAQNEKQHQQEMLDATLNLTRLKAQLDQLQSSESSQ